MNERSEDGEVMIIRSQESARTPGRLRPQHLLLTLLGDYWFGHHEHVPSAALVDLLGELGVTNASARAALSRLQRRGLLDSSRTGRHTRYGLTEQAAALLVDGRRRILSFGLEEQPWDGCWTVVCFSVPERERQLRHLLRTRLSWLGFAPLYDGVWVSPFRPVDTIRQELAELGIERASVFVSRTLDQDATEVVGAWELDCLRMHYASFIEEHRELLERMRAGNVGAAEALVVRTHVMDAWRQFPKLDPELPTELLPAQWPRTAAREIFAELYDNLGPLAVVRVQQIFATHEPELAGMVRFHSTAVIAGDRVRAD